MRLHLICIWVACAVLYGSGCAPKSNLSPDLESNGQAPQGHDIETIAILGTNDLHGVIAPQTLKTRELDGVIPIEYQAGGISYLASYVKILRSEFGRNLIWLDAGDEFQGSIESNQEQGRPLVTFFNQTGLHAAAIGNHEFDFGLDALKERMLEAQYPYLGANILSKNSNRLANKELPHLKSHALIDAGRIKVGVIGLSTIETPQTTRSVYVQDLDFGDAKEATLREAAEVRKAGADIVIAVAHVGLKCEKGRVPSLSHIRKPTDPQGDCGSRDELVRLLRNLPAGTIDAVVAGHSHQIVHHWVAGVPVIEGGAFGRFFNVIYLSFDLKTRKLLGDLTQIEGPVSVCPKVFANQGDCNGERPAPKAGRGQLVAPKFHNKIVSQDTPSANLISSVLEKTAEIKKRVIVTASRPIEHERFKESALGDLFADAMIAASNADVAILNPGGIRSSWEQGPVTYESVFRSFPFEDSIVTVKVTGTELKTFLRIVESGARGFYSVSGIQLRLLHPDSDAPAQDLNDDGKVEAWEVNRILDARFLTDGKPINDSQEYTLALLDFLATGGDDLGWIMSQIPKDRIHHDPHTPPLRDAVIQYAQKLGEAGPLNSVERPIISATHPRLKFEKPAGKKGKARGSKKSRRKKH